MSSPVLLTQIAALRSLKVLAHRILAGTLTQEQLTYQLVPHGSHILWLTGHLAVTNDLAMGPTLGLEPVMPHEASELLQFGAKPMADAGLYGSFEDYRRILLESFDRLSERLSTMEDEELLIPLPENSALAKLLPYRGSLLAMWQFHTGYHLGQVTLLRRAQGLGAGIGM
jgi:hypothetical protein